MMLGVNTRGHKGWTTLRCSICNKKLTVGEEVIYICPKCSSQTQNQSKKIAFCRACARTTHYRCPYCSTELQIYP